MVMDVAGGTLRQLAPAYLYALVGRYDPGTFAPRDPRTRVRLEVVGQGEWDAVLEAGGARLAPAKGAARALISAAPSTWEAISEDPARALPQFRSGRLSVRRNMHLGIGFLAATSGRSGPDRLRFVDVRTRGARISTIQAGAG